MTAFHGFRHGGRSIPRQTESWFDCKAVSRMFECIEWRVASGQRNPRPLKTVRDFMRGVASLGGFLCRKSDGEPGWKTIWRGLETLLVALRGYRAAVKKYG